MKSWHQTPVHIKDASAGSTLAKRWCEKGRITAASIVPKPQSRLPASVAVVTQTVVRPTVPHCIHQKIESQPRDSFRQALASFQTLSKSPIRADLIHCRRLLTPLKDRKSFGRSCARKLESWGRIGKSAVVSARGHVLVGCATLQRDFPDISVNG